MSDNVHLTSGDLGKLLRALESVSDPVESREDEAAAGLDTATGQARLDRLWGAFLSAAGSESRELAMTNDNQTRTEAPVQGLEINQIEFSWFSDGAARQNASPGSLSNTIPWDAADVQARTNEQTDLDVERVTLADGRVVTRRRTAG